MRSAGTWHHPFACSSLVRPNAIPLSNTSVLTSDCPSSGPVNLANAISATMPQSRQPTAIVSMPSHRWQAVQVVSHVLRLPELPQLPVVKSSEVVGHAANTCLPPVRQSGRFRGPRWRTYNIPPATVSRPRRPAPNENQSRDDPTIAAGHNPWCTAPSLPPSSSSRETRMQSDEACRLRRRLPVSANTSATDPSHAGRRVSVRPGSPENRSVVWTE